LACLQVSAGVAYNFVTPPHFPLTLNPLCFAVNRTCWLVDFEFDFMRYMHCASGSCSDISRYL